MINLKRIYEPYSKDDGFRILVDRLWPRGVSKERAKLGVWLKDIAPSTELRRWFDHDPKKWVAFKRRYRAELKANEKCLAQIQLAITKHKVVTLLYAAKDEAHNEAVVIGDVLKRMEAQKTR